MKKSNPLPTMKDVAQEAGVALGTVSKVFNGLPVGESYRLKVEAAAKKLGYQVNTYARGLKTNKTYTVALILPSVVHPFFAALCEGVYHSLAKHGYRTLLAVTSSDPEAEQQCINMVQQNKVDGIIALTYNPNLQIDESLPFVSIDRYFGPTVPCISSDNYGGGQMAAEKLLRFGCKHLLFFRIGSSVPGESDKRGDGFESICRLRNVDYATLRLNDSDGLEPFRSYLQEHMVNGKLAYDGIFCSTDLLACQIRQMLLDLGVHAPEDVQLIGFDGLRHFGTEQPYCSSIAQPTEQLAEASVDILLNEERSKLPAIMCLPVRYVPGGTTRDC